MRSILAVVFCICCVTPLLAQKKEEDRLKQSHDVLREVLGVPDKGIPVELVDNARCVAVFPSLKKAALIPAASYGRGVIVCRTGQTFSGPWGAPAMFALEGGSIAFQIGSDATDFVLLVMSEKGANSVMCSKVRLGTDASVAPGPVGHASSDETNIPAKAEILSYSIAGGVLQGALLEGSTLRSDSRANKHLYGKEVDAEQVVRENNVKVPIAGESLVNLLRQSSPKRAS